MNATMEIDLPDWFTIDGFGATLNITVRREDTIRLTRALDRVLNLMSDFGWHTGVDMITTGGTEGLRRWREIRRALHRRGVETERRDQGNGTWGYRIVRPGSIEGVDP